MIAKLTKVEKRFRKTMAEGTLHAEDTAA